MTSIPYAAKLAIVILLVVALAEVIPDYINALLGLVLVGIVLTNWQKFSGLASALGTLGK